MGKSSMVRSPIPARYVQPYGGFDFSVAARRPGPFGPGFCGGSERTRPTYYIEVETAREAAGPLETESGPSPP